MAEDLIRSIADRLEITDVVTRFHRAVDSGNFEALADVFTDDAVWDWVASDATGEVADTAQGRDNVIEWLRTAMSGSTVRHATTGHLVELDDDRARSTSYMHVVDITTLESLANGFVTGEHRRTSSGWRMSRLRIDERIGNGSVDSMKKLLEL